jgi:L-fuconate dehydratase
VSTTQADRAIEWVDHLHEHFTDPAVVRAGYYLATRKPGFFARMHDATLRRYRFPDGPEWTGENS